MKNFCWLLNRHLSHALWATPLILSSSYAFSEEVLTVDDSTRTAVAAEKPIEPVPDWTLSYNLGLTSAYMFRGVVLSDGPAVQGGIDLVHSSGFYVGTWWSSSLDPYYNGKTDQIEADPTALPDPIEFSPATKGNHVEADWYFGYMHTFESGLGLNLLGNYYTYPEGHRMSSGKTENSFETSMALSYEWLTYTYYRVLTDYYGSTSESGSTKGANYHELKVNYGLPFGGLNLMTSVGYQRTPNLTASQGDFALGLDRDFSIPAASKVIDGFNAGVLYTHTFDVEDQTYFMVNGRDLNKDRVSFYIKRTW